MCRHRRRRRGSVEEADRHLLFDVGALEGAAELVKGNHLVAVLVGLADGALGDADQLVLADVVADHHLQHAEQLLLGDELVVVRVVHLEGEAQLALARVQPVLAVLLHRPEVRQHLPIRIQFISPLGHHLI